MPCPQLLEREPGGELTLRLKEQKEEARQEGVIERGDMEKRGEREGCRRERMRERILPGW